LKFGISIGPKIPVSECVELAVYAEKVGFDYVWVADEVPTSPYRDPYQTLAVIAMNTSRVKLGPAVSNPYSRHPAHIAFAAATLGEVSKGRAVLGMGVGGSLSLAPIGIKMWHDPVKTLKEAAVTIRQLLRGEAVSVSTDTFSLRNAALTFNTSTIPIYLAARRPALLRLTGEVADGSLISAYPPSSLEMSIKHITEGAQSSGRSLTDMDIGVLILTSIADDAGRAIDAVRPNIAYTLADSPTDMVARIGVDSTTHQAIKETLVREGPSTAAKLVTDQMVKSIGIVGSVDDALEKCEEYMRYGADHIIFGQPFGPDPQTGLRMLGQVLERLKERSA
jgi:5,10-methylenetetrahydromethanopterin reductase